MQPTTTRGATHNFAPPENWDTDKDGTCSGLQVRVDKWGERDLLDYVSTWKPTPLDLEALNAGGVIELHLLGVQCPTAMSIVAPTPEPLFDDHGPATP